MLSSDEKIIFYSVYKKSGVSKSFVYNNQEIKTIIEIYRKDFLKKKQGKEAKDVIIETQKKKISNLEKQIREYEKAETTKINMKSLWPRTKI